MGRLIEEQAVIDCLTNTAKYYEREDADEWTKGIHYGLLHGLDNILDNVPTVEAITKDQYEARLKAILVELQLEIEEIEMGNNVPFGFEPVNKFYEGVSASSKIIQQKIRELEENQ
jgi:hypothetical protein